MSYGRARMFFATAVEAQRYLDNCRAASNYTAENYQDRVAAQRAVRYELGTLSPPPLKDLPRESIPRRRKTA